jgi:hypothetical protein
MEQSKKEYYRDLIRSSNGKIFHVEYFKKGGEFRKMNARIGVKKGVNGKGLKYDPFEKGYLVAFDMEKDGFRNINLNTIQSISLVKE